jgi:RimJ/RimL family protein N-acetyltransferase
MTASDAIELETPRLRLRPHSPDDFDASFALWTDPGVTRFIGGRPSTREEVWSRVLRYIGHWRAFGYGYWAIEEIETGSCIGECGFADFHREIDPPILLPEMGWALHPAVHGRGYATEAVQAALAWGDRRFGGAAMQCIIGPENAPSLSLAARCGFVEIARTLYRTDPVIVLERPGAAIGARP